MAARMVHSQLSSGGSRTGGSLSMSASISACVRVPEYSGAYVPDLARYAKEYV